MAVSRKMMAFCNIAQRRLIEAHQHFRDAYYLHHLGDDFVLMMEAVSTFEILINVYKTT
jgi:hypothetical protein